MTLKESTVGTVYLREGETFDVKLYYSDELKETSVFDLAYSSVHGAFLPYLFSGYVKSEDQPGKWYFSNARSHKELKAALTDDMDVEPKYVNAQINFGPEVVDGILKISTVILHEDISDDPQITRQALENLFGVIKPSYMDDIVNVYILNTDNENNYLWRKEDDSISPFS